MKKGNTSLSVLPSPISDSLKEAGFLTDNELADSIARHGVFSLASRLGFNKHCGYSMNSVLYDLLKRENLNWRGIVLMVSRLVINHHGLADDDLTALESF